MSRGVGKPLDLKNTLSLDEQKSLWSSGDGNSESIKTIFAFIRCENTLSQPF